MSRSIFALTSSGGRPQAGWCSPDFQTPPPRQEPNPGVPDEVPAEPDLIPFAVRTAVDALYRAGAIATLATEPRPILVGDIHWLPGTGLLLFAAYGDGPGDAHLVHFDSAVVNSSGSITFARGSKMEGTLHRIEEADLDDPDDYRIAWQLWQEVAPVHRPLIERCFAAIERDGPPGCR
jgi:hypothetical protein